MHRCLRTVLLGGLLLAPSALRAQAGLLVPTSSGRPDSKVLSLRELTIEVGIARGYARVNVRQVFENHTDAIQEGTYRFALPASAAVGDFAIWDGLQRIPGVILEKQRARAIYQQLTTQRIDPGLLQQGEEEDQAPGTGPASARPSGGALFSVTVAPIPPRATKRLELQFHQEVPFIQGVGEFRLVLRPPDGEAPVARTFTARVMLEDGTLEPVAAGFPLQAIPGGGQFTGSNVPLDKDLVLRIRPRQVAPLQLSAFRNPEGLLPDGLALAPWERPSEIPPEKDGFFLLQAMPPSKGQAGSTRPTGQDQRPALALAILFDTSLGHRWGGLETAYGHLVQVLGTLAGQDRFALIPFDRKPADASLRPVQPKEIEAQLTALRNRPLGPGSDLIQALSAARKLVGDRGRILLLSSGGEPATGKALRAAAGSALLFTVITAGEPREALRSASTHLISPTATSLESELFFKRMLDPLAGAALRATPQAADPAAEAPFRVTGGQPKLRHIYAVGVNPMEPGSLSGWVGRYAVPQAELSWDLPSALFPGGQASLKAGLPEKALAARDLPRRWARARVDDLLARIEADGERREWVDELIALAKRYKFVTPYTAFLAAPRSLLRPRRIQPGDPVLRVECDAGTVSATALLPFGLKLPLVRQPNSRLWEGRFLVPEGFADGRHAVRILLRDSSGAHLTETKYFILDGQAPVIQPELPAMTRSGDQLTIRVRTDADVVTLTARVGEAPPVPLRWDAATGRCVGVLRVPDCQPGRQEVFFEAVDGAKNRGFARAILEVRP